MIRLLAAFLLAAALVVTPVSGPTPVAFAATPTAFTDLPTTAVVGAPYTFSGTVTDESPVASVDVSTDGGVTWKPAGWQAGQTAWSHTFTPTSSGTAQLRVRALDAAQAAVGQASAETNIAPRVCPCGVWTDADVPGTADAADTNAVELGLKWRSTTNGYVRGVRFYKGPDNSGTHTGSLWSSAGVLLATGTFRGETASGWQTLVFPAPVAVNGNTTYVVSYLSPTGHFSVDQGYFAQSSRYLEPLTGLQTGVDGVNGVYRSGGGFPITASTAANYWVDVVWAPEPGADTRAPDLVRTTPSTGAGSVALNGPISAAYDEPVVAATTEFTLTGPSGPVAGRITLSGNGKTADFTPTSPLAGGTAFTASVRVRDAAGNQTGTHTWQFRTGSPRPAACPCTLWDDFATPAVPASDDTREVELGNRVRFGGKGEVLGVRFYKGPGNTGTHTGSFWTTTGLLLATGTFTDETETGWQTLTFAEPVTVLAGTDYVVTYLAPNGRYAVNQKHFQSQATTYGPITGLVDTPTKPNGLFRYGGGFPTTGYLSSNYWVDVVYRNGLNGDTTKPTLDTRTPAPGATNVALDGSLTLGFSEAIDPDSLVVTVADAGWGGLTGTATLSADQKTATWTPDARLQPGNVYGVQVQAADVNGNSLVPVAAWNFTTQATVSCPCSLFSAATVPTIPAANDSGAYELGLRFTTTRGGLIRGVRFYKGPGNTGTHTGSLWNSAGQRIASGTFTNETETGWQTLTFAEPVSIASNTMYTASYTAPNGHYSVDHQYFERRWPGANSPPLSTTGGGAAGVFTPGGGYPSKSIEGNHYWIDVDFTLHEDVTPPVHIGHTPTNDSTDIALDGSVSISFNEQVSTTNSSVEVKDARDMVMRGNLTLADNNTTLVWKPIAPLVRSTKFTVTVRGADIYENKQTDATTWSYTTANPPCPCSLYSEAAVPTVLETGYYGGVGIGVRVIPSVDGFITGIKYYRSRANRGPHGAYLSLSRNIQLASAGFANETAEGWQTARFANPVPVTAGTTYIAWYDMPEGRYSQIPQYFRYGGTVTPQLTAPGGPGSVGNGMWGRILGYPDFPGDPTGDNMFVDVIFTTS